MIKILVDAHYFDDYYSGASTYLKGLYSELVKIEELEIHLASNNLDRLKENFTDPRFKFIKLESKSNIGRLFWEFPRIIKAGNFEYAHFTYFAPFVKRCKYIVTLHDLLFIDFPEYFSFKYRISRSVMFYLSAKLANILLTISNYSKEKLIEHFRIDRKKIDLTPCATVQAYKNSLGAQKLPYILYVSRIEPRKNHIQLVKAYVELELYKEYELLFVGKSSIGVSYLEEYLLTLNKEIRKKIIHKENVSEEELSTIYSQASLFVFPSVAEGFGIPPLEALAARTKVICSNATALADFTFLKGFQFDPLDLDSLKSVLIKALDEKNYPFDEMESKISKMYSWEDAALNLYKRMSSK